MSIEELREILLSHIGRGICGWIKSIRNRDIICSLYENTPLLDSRHTLLTRIFWILKGIKDFPTCMFCGNKMKDKNITCINKGYSKFCSYECANKYAKGKNKGISNVRRLEIEAEKRKNRNIRSATDYKITEEGVVVLPCGLDIIGTDKIDNTLEIHHIVYKMTNKVNGHYYIGHHSTLNPLDEYTGSGVAITCAIKKYGIKQFKKEILADCDSLEKSCALEASLVTEKECIESNHMCYNLKPGGYGGCDKRAGRKGAETRRIRGYKHSERTKKLISDANKGKPKSEEHKEMLRKNHRGRRKYKIIYENGEQHYVIDSIPGIARKYNILNLSKFNRRIKSGKFYNGILVVRI